MPLKLQAPGTGITLRIDSDSDPGAVMGARKGIGPFLIKALVSASLLGGLCYSLDMQEIIRLLQAMSWVPFFLAVTMFCLQCGFAGLRCHAIAGTSVSASISDHIRFCWIGQFFSQLLPSTIGGDGVRAWLFTGCGTNLAGAIRLVLVDRLFGLIGLLVIAAAVMAPLLPSSLPRMAMDARVFGICLGAALLGLVSAIALLSCLSWRKAALRFRPVRALISLGQDLLRPMRRPAPCANVVVLTALIHFCSIAAFWLVALAIAAPCRLIDALMIVPPMLLVSTIPVSLAGWGVREGFVLFGGQLMGMPPEGALPTAILFGLALLIASLPGSLFWHRIPASSSQGFLSCSSPLSRCLRTMLTTWRPPKMSGAIASERFMRTARPRHMRG